MNRNEALAERIASVFADVHHPDEGCLLRGDAGWEGGQLEPSVRGMQWHEIPLDVLRRFPTGLLLLTPEGFRYCLPAYLLAALKDREEIDVLPELVFATLTPSGSDWDRTRLLDQASILTPQQWNATRSFVCHFLDAEKSYPAEKRDAALAFWVRIHPDTD